MAVVLWAITGSALALLFAALGPVAALATVIDGRLGGRRSLRRDRRRYAQELAALELRIDGVNNERVAGYFIEQYIGVGTGRGVKKLNGLHGATLLHPLLHPFWFKVGERVDVDVCVNRPTGKK
jgi:hypothetical protein